ARFQALACGGDGVHGRGGHHGLPGEPRGARWRMNALTFVSGIIFALGLGIGGMAHPSKVLGFLDVAGSWDPSLMFVMGGALLVDALFFRVILRRPTPRFDTTFHLPWQKQVDARLVVGAVVFGVGWGLSGYCPGPALLSVVTLSPDALAFVAA